MPAITSATGSELFIVDNSNPDWQVRRYLHDWCQIAKQFDIATGYFEIGAFLCLNQEWQKLDKVRLLMGDEVFSAVELGCMKLLCEPSLESFTICGDPMQRLTAQGIQDWGEMTEITGPFSSTVLGRSYRQTARLLEVAIDLYRNFMAANPPFVSAYTLSAGDPPPLAFKSSAADSAEEWITERIIEIWETNGNKLPSIGIFVPESADEAGWVKRLTDRLYDNAINVEGSGNGASLGNAHRVRVFPVTKIKGLEFEAAFFVDIDRMADKAPGLIEKYLYVGLSRARSYLGVTYSSNFPRKLSCVRKHFSDLRAFAPQSTLHKSSDS